MKKISLLFLFVFVLLTLINSQVVSEIEKSLPLLIEESATNDQLGKAVSVEGNYAVVGSAGYSVNKGKATVIFNNGTTWEKVAVLTALDGTEGDCFGSAVSISGSTIVVGAYYDDEKSGSAYVFEKPDAGWKDMTETAKLNASDGAEGDYLGCSIDISGSTIVVGAYGDESEVGAVYVFEKPDAGWKDMTETAKLKASDGSSDDDFGWSVSMSNKTVVVGAYRNDDDDDVNNGRTVGSAYVFEEPDAGWGDMTETAKLLASDGEAGDFFGCSVSITGSTVVIGAFYDDYDDVQYSDQGSAYIFEKPDTGWGDMTETAKLQPSYVSKYSYFGSSVDISDSVIAIGAYGTSEVYIFKKSDAGWSDTTEMYKLTASDGAYGDYFGWAVSMSDNVIVVGAYGVDDIGSNSGSAYIFEKPDTGWAKMTESYKYLPTVYDTKANYYYGTSVKIDGDIAVVGAPGSDCSTGSAFVLQKNGNSWEHVAVLSASDGAGGDKFGSSVDVSNTTIVVGVPYDDDSGAYSGSAYVYEKPDSGWSDMTETAKLTASEGEGLDYFGFSVGVFDSTIVVGAFGDGSSSGSVYVFEKTDSGWTDTTEIAKLTASDSYYLDYFGVSVGISNNTIVVGACGNDDDGSNSGSAYIFEKSDTGWADITETAKLTASDGAEGDYFGNSVGVSNNTIVVGARYGNDGDGSAYVFEKPDKGWDDMTETAKLTASDLSSQDYFGWSVSISDSTILVGSPRSDDNGDESGSAYIFKQPKTGWIDTIETSKIIAADGSGWDYFGYSVGISGSDFVIGAYKEDGNGIYSGSAYFYSIYFDSVSTSVNTESFKTCIVYPNPTNGVINISLENNQTVNLNIYNITGSLVYSKASFNGGAVDLSELNTGMYILHLNSNGVTEIRKLIKK